MLAQAMIEKLNEQINLEFLLLQSLSADERLVRRQGL